VYNKRNIYIYIYIYIYIKVERRRKRTKGKSEWILSVEKQGGIDKLIPCVRDPRKAPMAAILPPCGNFLPSSHVLAID
jgi:hypothetical protein